MPAGSTKRIVLTLARACGLFALSRRVTRHDLRILCYHGAALDDEHRFSPGLFMSRDAFAARMALVARHGMTVLTLAEAVERLRAGTLPARPAVITIDDGWTGTGRHMAPVLARHGFPSTLYVSTYYVGRRMPVFNVALDYLLWKTERQGVALDDLGGPFDLRRSDDRARLRAAACTRAEEIDAADRRALLARLCDTLGIDWQEFERRRLFTFMSETELAEVRAQGMDLQLHTHRHRFKGLDLVDSRRELTDNAAVLAGVTDAALVHFCYPSGGYDPAQIAVLDALGIVSATTTRRGLARSGDPARELPRLLDSEDISDLEFEAELCGFLDLMRRGRALLRRRPVSRRRLEPSPQA